MKAGDIVASKYELVSRIGQGGMGAVWRASHTTTNRHFAIKFLHAAMAINEESRQRFVQEAQASARIDHPSIIDVFDLGETDDGTPFMVMELLDGISLAEGFRSKPPFSARDLLMLMAETSTALMAAHGAGVVHRDIKPANIFLHRDRAHKHVRAKVLDFGVSKILGGDQGVSTNTGSLLGSPRYMSPEQARSAAMVDARSDVWSVGVVLFEGLSGSFPHEGDNSTNLVVAIATKPPRRLEEAAPEIPTPLRKLVDDCLVPHARRIDSAAALLDRIFDVLKKVDLDHLKLATPRVQKGSAVIRSDSFVLPTSVDSIWELTLPPGSDTSASTVRGPRPGDITLPYPEDEPPTDRDESPSSVDAASSVDAVVAASAAESGVQAAGAHHVSQGSATLESAGREAEPMLAARLVVLVLKQLEAHGHSAARLKERYGIVIEGDTLPMGKMRVRDIESLFEDVAGILSRPNLGLDLGTMMELGSYGLIEFMIRSVSTVAEGLEQLGRYAQLVNTGVLFRLEDSVLSHRAPGRAEGLGRHVNEYTMAFVLRFTRLICGAHVCPIQVDFAHADPASGDELSDFFGTTRFTFGGGVSRIHFDPADTARAVLHRDPALHAFLDSQLKAALQAQVDQDPTTTAVRRELRAMLEGGTPSLRAVAARLELGPEALERQLAAQGKPFEVLLDLVREDLARAYLQNPSLGPSEVGYLLGYDSLDTFERAFERWTGETPVAWQRSKSA